jgi:hypothetical protein
MEDIKPKLGEEGPNKEALEAFSDEGILDRKMEKIYKSPSLSAGSICGGIAPADAALMRN